ncbi:MAG: YbhB/YbcL family Raf kinase inhibitor-like protein [Halodesulfurarchaeum sp.]
MSGFTLESPEFVDGGPIPDRFGYTNRNVNPPLEWEGVPDGTESLALVMDDPDAVEPAGKIWDHWVVWHIDPARGSIPADWDAAGAVEGRNDFGETGYGGPNPPDREHTYVFTLYALDEPLDLPPGSTKQALEDAIGGTVLDEATLEGTYAP